MELLCLREQTENKIRISFVKRSFVAGDGLEMKVVIKHFLIKAIPINLDWSKNQICQPWPLAARLATKFAATFVEESRDQPSMMKANPITVSLTSLFSRTTLSGQLSWQSVWSHRSVILNHRSSNHIVLTQYFHLAERVFLGKPFTRSHKRFSFLFIPLPTHGSSRRHVMNKMTFAASRSRLNMRTRLNCNTRWRCDINSTWTLRLLVV